MFSLIITLVAVALVAALALATLYYGAPSFLTSGARARATTAISQSSQVLGAAELYFVERKAWSTSVDDLVGREYLKDAPNLQGLSGNAVPWTQPMPSVPTYWALKTLDVEACRDVNRMARGDNGIYKMARPGLVTQCFGTAEPFTVITTRQGMTEAGTGLDVVFDFFDQLNPGSGVGYAPDGGGWAVEPSTSGPGPSEPSGPPADKGTPGGGYLDGDVQVTLPGQGGAGSNVVKVGDIASNGKGQVVIDFTNSGSSPWTVGKVGTCGDYHVVGSTCSGVVEPGQSCQVIVEAGPFPDLTEPRDLSGCVRLETDKGNVQVGLEGKVYPSAPGPVQVGISTNDPKDSATHLVFPDTEVGQTSYKWVRVQNVGDNLIYGGTPLVVSPPFSVTESTCSGSLPYGASCMARLAFSPTAATLYDAANNRIKLMANGQSVDIGVSGRGTPKPVAGVSVLPASIDWAQRAALGQYSDTVTVRNNGETVLALAQPPAVTQGAEAFRVTASTCLGAISPKSYCTVTLQFYPDKAQVFEGKLTLEFTDRDLGVREVPLAGTATNPLKFTAQSLTGAFIGRAYTSQDLRGAWSLASSTITPSALELSLAPGSQLPPGLAFNSATGRVEGKATAAADMSFTLKARYQSRFDSTGTFQLKAAEASYAKFRPNTNVVLSGDNRIATLARDSVTSSMVMASRNTGKWYTAVTARRLAAGNPFAATSFCLGYAAYGCEGGRFFDLGYANSSGAGRPGDFGLNVDSLTGTPFSVGIAFDVDARRVSYYDLANCRLIKSETWTRANSWATVQVSKYPSAQETGIEFKLPTPTSSDSTELCRPVGYEWLTE